MSVTPKALINSKAGAITDTVEYTAPALTHTIIDKFTATNNNAGAQTLTVNIIPSGAGPAAASNMITKAVSIATGVTYSASELQNQILNPGDAISVKVSSTDVTIRSSGREVT